ncbi:transcription/translation regulatory transformer protein RfaH [Pleionea sediminis]|uniref:transcription/translation regulatory transformer protein RfaH n=1 Tax=Pleionea sediminis TaxID=2569479 RepID=UPI0011869400|nr:transcription/translation regulatory transformer protein RfaH [Pleionea sediminis]
MSKKDWYLVATKPKQESRAKEHLANQGIEFFLPEVEIEKAARGKRVVRKEPLFPGYVFVLLSDSDALWSKVRSTRGLRDFIRFSGRPAKVASSIVEHLKLELDSRDLKLSQIPQKGSKVLLTSGPFRGLEAIFEVLDGEHRAIILLELLGKAQRITVELGELNVG